MTVKSDGAIFRTVVITHIKEEANNVKLFYLKEKGDQLAYRSGQYLTFLLPAQEDELRRSYSLASSPTIDPQMFIGVKRIHNGIFSRHLYDRAQPGDEFVTSGAGGVFTLPENMEGVSRIFLFAAGSGIVPIFSIIKTLLFQHSNTEVVLIYSNSNIKSTIFYGDLERLKDEFQSRFLVHYLFSDNKNLFRAHLHAALIEEFVTGSQDYSHQLFYICGPEPYMRLCTYTLRGLAVPADHIKKEIFHTARTIRKLAPPGEAAHIVTIILGQVQHDVKVQYPETILSAARKQGIALPYSCEAGRCGNCLARCNTGKIWMAYNEVLTDKEVTDGLILTCTGYPVEGDAVIKIY